MSVQLIPATLAHTTYVAANLRLQDQEEFEAVFGTDIPVTTIAGHMVVASRYAYAVLYDGQPVFIFGVALTHNHLGMAWGFGTSKAKRAIPAVAHHVHEQLVPSLLAAGVRRVEVRVLADAASSVKWLAVHMDAKFETPLPDCGVNGELFLQYAWTRGSVQEEVDTDVLFPATQNAGCGAG